MTSVTKRRKSSALWNFFTPIDETFAACNICKKKCSYKTSTSNLRKHVDRKHPSVATNLESSFKQQKRGSIRISLAGSQDVKDENTSDSIELPVHTTANDNASSSVNQVSGRSSELTTRQGTSLNFVCKKTSATQKKNIDTCIMNLFAVDLQPLSVVEDQGFKQFVHALNPSYELPTRKTLSETMLPALYKKCLCCVKEAMNTVVGVCLTTDCWTSAVNDNLLAVTAHFIEEKFIFQSVLLDCVQVTGSYTSEALANNLERIIQNWNLGGKVLAAVSDNSVNIRKAITDHLCLEHFGCFAHTLNLIVQDALVAFKSLHEKIKIIVAHFKCTATATEKLIGFQTSETPKRLLQDVPTRWNSTFYMIERFVELEDAVRASLALANKGLPTLSVDDWCALKNLSKVLKPFEEVTKIISSENYMTASQVIVLVKGLKNICCKLLSDNLHPIAHTVVLKLQAGIETRFLNLEANKIVGGCTFLDPRFKHRAFSNKAELEEIKKDIIKLTGAKEKAATEPKETNVHQSHNQTLADTSTIQSHENFSVWDDFDCALVTAKPQETPTSKAIVEVQRYLEEELLVRTGDPLKWWQEHSYDYPLLSKVVQEKFCVVATSVPCQRIFSKAGAVLNDRRTRLSPRKLQQSIFLNCNKKYI